MNTRGRPPRFLQDLVMIDFLFISAMVLTAYVAALCLAHAFLLFMGIESFTFRPTLFAQCARELMYRLLHACEKFDTHYAVWKQKQGYK
jgi:hypothetical protein